MDHPCLVRSICKDDASDSSSTPQEPSVCTFCLSNLKREVRNYDDIIIFPGGAGTAEELLYLLGIMLHEENKDQVLPVILTGPSQSAAYFTELQNFIAQTLGNEALALFEVIIDDPALVAQKAETRLQRSSPIPQNCW